MEGVLGVDGDGAGEEAGALRAVVHAFQKTGLEETSFDRVFDVVAELATVEGAAKIHASQVRVAYICSEYFLAR